jgi:hypothetical protein
MRSVFLSVSIYVLFGFVGSILAQPQPIVEDPKIRFHAPEVGPPVARWEIEIRQGSAEDGPLMGPVFRWVDPADPMATAEPGSLQVVPLTGVEIRTDVLYQARVRGYTVDGRAGVWSEWGPEGGYPLGDP